MPKLVPVAATAELTRDLDLPEPEMIRIEPGGFLIGCSEGEDGGAEEKPQHRVQIARPFAICKYAITFDEYDVFARTTNGYVILEDHCHLLAAGDPLGKSISSLKSYTARRIVERLTERKSPVREPLAFHKARHKVDRQHQVWQEGSHPE